MPSIGRLTRPVSFALPRGATARRLGIALAVLVLLGGGWLLLRKSPLVSVEHVQIAGVQGVDAGPIDAALRGAARGMSTLNVNVAALRGAVAPFQVVRDLSVSTSFPHGLRIHVVEQLPVAVLSVGRVRTAVAADGVVLGSTLSDLLASERVPLPAIALAAGSSALADLRSVGGHVENATARAELSVLGAAPRVLLGWVSKVFIGPEGLTVSMRNGVLIYFGDATRPHAKWLSAARVLADPSSAGATYVDVRAPERPAAGTTAVGGLAGDTTAGQTSATDATSAALANVLAEAISGGSGAASATGSAAGASSGAASTTTVSPLGATGAAGSGTTSSTPEPSTTEASAANSGAGTAAGASEVGSTTEPSATGVTGSG